MLVTEKVPCCVCAGSGKTRRMLWNRECAVCDGSGERTIIMDAAFPDDVKTQIRMEATFGINRFPATAPGS